MIAINFEKKYQTCLLFKLSNILYTCISPKDVPNENKYSQIISFPVNSFMPYISYFNNT